MGYPQAIIMGAALIAAAIFFTNGAPVAEAQRTGPWQMQIGSDHDAITIAWRRNTETGEMHLCHDVATKCVKMTTP